MVFYELTKDGKIISSLNEEIQDTWDNMKDFLNDPSIVAIDGILLELSKNHFTHSIIDQIEDEVSEFVYQMLLETFKDKFKAGRISERDFLKIIQSKETEARSKSKLLADDIKKYSLEKVKEIFNFNTKTGGNMFKTLKEAKIFTSHLDAIANEIEKLENVDGETKKTLAHRIDKLADLIEVEADRSEKVASLQKDAYGIGSGTLVHDADEAYMQTFGGTGVLKGDADEPYMAQYNGDDHKEVLQRKEPATISGNGNKVPQPSDNYNAQANAQKLKGLVQNVMAKLK